MAATPMPAASGMLSAGASVGTAGSPPASRAGAAAHVRPGKSRYDSIQLHPAKPAATFADWKGVWVIAEHRDGKLRDVTLELMGAARPMADKLGHKLTAILLAEHAGDLPRELLEAGADGVLVCEHPILRTPLARPSADVLTRLISERKPNIVLIGATHTGRDVSSRVAVQVDAGMTADCTELDVDVGNGELLARRPAFGGKMLATIRCDRHRPQMATARPGIFKPLDTKAGRKGPIEPVDVKWLSQRTYAAELLDYFIDKGTDITKSEVLVSGGIGVGGPEGFQKLQELADALGGMVAASRAACDKGWIERSRQVGQTGVSVRPKLYIAVGISGAIQHIEGMKESGTVVAINNDPHAPIFHYADVALVGDWKGHVEALTTEARKRNLSKAKWMVPARDTLDADRQEAHKRAQKAADKNPSPAPATNTGPTPMATPAAPAASASAVASLTSKTTSTPAAVVAAHATPAPPLSSVTAGKSPPSPATQAGAALVTPEQVGGKFTGNPKDLAAVKLFARSVPEEKKAWVLAADCIVCNGCQAACPTDAAIVTDMARVDRDLCIADGACFDACPTAAIRPGLEEQARSGGWPKGSRLAGKFGTPEA